MHGLVGIRTLQVKHPGTGVDERARVVGITYLNVPRGKTFERRTNDINATWTSVLRMTASMLRQERTVGVTKVRAPKYARGRQPQRSKGAREKHNNVRQPNKYSQARQAKQLHVLARKLEIGNCTDCGLQVTTHNFVVFQFDHIDRTTKTHKIADMVKASCTLNDIDLEIAKCELVCANCHTLRTYYRRDHDTLKEPKQTHPDLFSHYE